MERTSRTHLERLLLRKCYHSYRQLLPLLPLLARRLYYQHYELSRPPLPARIRLLLVMLLLGQEESGINGFSDTTRGSTSSAPTSTLYKSVHLHLDLMECRFSSR
jgi:hypothetical protein